MAKVVFVIAQRGFRDEELFQPLDILKEHELAIASKTTATARGVLGKEIKPDLSLHQALGKDWDAVVFVGGPGCAEYFSDHSALELARATAKAGKVLAAICLAPIILAKAGVLKGKKATVWDSGDGSCISQLRAAGAEYSDQDVVIDGKLITASGPHAAKQFGQAIAKALK